MKHYDPTSFVEYPVAYADTVKQPIRLPPRPFTLEDFRSWVRSKNPCAWYDFQDVNNCAFTQYGRERGLNNLDDIYNRHSQLFMELTPVLSPNPHRSYKSFGELARDLDRLFPCQ